MNLRRGRAVGRKELLHIVRDSRSLSMALLVPFIMLGLFGYALSLDVNHLPMMIYDQDRTATSRDLVERFRATSYFDVKSSEATYQEIEAAINRNKIVLGIVIPPDYGKKMASGKLAPVQVLLDGSDSNTASIALGYVDSLTSVYSVEQIRGMANQRAGAHAEPIADAQVRILYNEDLKSRNFIVPGLIAVIMTIIASLLTSLTIAREWENGTMEQLLSTPLRPAELLLGKLAAFFLIGVADTVMAVLAGVFLFDVPLKGNLFFLGFTSFVFLFGALSWGIFISAAAKSQLIAYQIGLLSSFLPAFLLSGFIYSIDNMPLPIRVISTFVPARYYVSILEGVFLKGTGFRVLWYEVMWLFLYSSVVFTMAVRKLRTKVA